MKLLLDMNLSPVWKKYLNDNGFDALHWTEIGPPDAADIYIITSRNSQVF